MDAMRSCSAAVIHVGAEAELTDEDVRGHPQINPNVLIEIGAAMMQCPDRFILVVEDGLELPSNLQGLYQYRYSGDGLDWDAGMKILEAIRGLKEAA
jgi:predicted nucleotide-binding protein